MKITKRQLKQIIQEELAQVVSERSSTIDDVRNNPVRAGSGPRAKYGRMMPKAEFDALEAGDLSTSEPATPDEQYPTSPSEYTSDELSSMTSMPSTPEQDAYARKLFGIPEVPAKVDNAGQPLIFSDEWMAARDIAKSPQIFQGNKGDPYEYKEVDGQYQARKKGSDKWRKVPTNSPAHASIASVQKGGKSLYKRPKAAAPKAKAPVAKPVARPVDAAPAQKPAAPATPAVAAAPVSDKQKKRNQMADAFEKAQRKKGILTPKAQAKAAKIRKRGKKLNPFD